MFLFAPREHLRGVIFLFDPRVWTFWVSTVEMLGVKRGEYSEILGEYSWDARSETR